MYKKNYKRVIDIVLSLIVLPFLLIILIPVAIAIKIEDGGPVFYMDKRLGLDMIEYKMFKIRSMIVNAKDLRNPDGSTVNSADDYRVTKIGKFIRKTSIDELPQVLNVLKGEMSLIGPRPSPLGNIDSYTEEYKKKFTIRPGITGYEQVKMRNAASREEREAMDIYYLDNYGFTLDAKIILWTIVVVFKRMNIYRN